MGVGGGEARPGCRNEPGAGRSVERGVKRAELFVWWWAATLSWTLVVIEQRECSGPTEAALPDAPEDATAEAVTDESCPIEASAPASAGAADEEHAPPSMATGRVLDMYGNPVERARVNFTGRRPGSVLTASDGSFAVPVDAGYPARVWCVGRPVREDGTGAACIGTDEVLAKAGDRDLVLRAEWFEGPPPAPAIVVVVLDPAGRPISDVLVQAPGDEADTDSEGRALLRIRQHEPFTPSIVWPGGRGPEDGWVLPVLEPRLPGEDCVIRYRIGRVVEGFIENLDGRAAEGIQVSITSGPIEIAVLRTDMSGRFSALVDPFPPAPYRVKAGLYDPWDGSWIDFVEAPLAESAPAILRLEKRR